MSPHARDVQNSSLKFFCPNGHEWYGECIPACCPACHLPAVGSTAMMAGGDAIGMVLTEHARGVQLHGTWHDYSVEQMMAAIINELAVEACDAESVGDIHGEHGVIRELTQVAACCLKAIVVLMGRTEGHLAETLRTAGAHSGFTGRALPASPSLHQGEESPSNRPIEGGQL